MHLLWRAARGWLVVFVAMLLVQGLLPVTTVLLTRRVVNELVTALELRTFAGFQPALLTVALLGGVVLIAELLRSFSAYVRLNLSEGVSDHTSDLIHRQANGLDLRFYDSPHSYDLLFRASTEAIDRPLHMLEAVGGLMQNAITLVAMAGILTLFGWWMPLVLIAGTLPALWVALRSSRDFHDWRLRNTMNERKLRYFQMAMTRAETAMEVRLFDLGDRFRRQYRDLRDVVRSERLQLARAQTLKQMAASALALGSMLLALVYMAWRTLRGAFNLGDLAMFYQAMMQGQRLMVDGLTRLGDVYRNLLFVEDLFTFLELQPQLADPESPRPMPARLTDGITFSEVTFAYPESARPALREFSLTIPAGKIVAIVGENGAGKSTLLKLVCRFYDPQAGRITWDGIDLRDVRQRGLRRHITVLFQQPVPYQETAGDNIRLGDSGVDLSHAAIRDAARMAGVDEVIARLPDGYDTVLGKWFGVTELSVGEWQRLALARAFVRGADLVILDEPTSAMDSWAEHAWIARFRAVVGGRTALIVTHRFSTAMSADLIYVMADGQVIESGSHAELVALGGHYARSWKQQIGADDAEDGKPTDWADLRGALSSRRA